MHLFLPEGVFTDKVGMIALFCNFFCFSTRYGWDGGDIPDSLKASCWMDGANGQLKDITTEANLLIDHQLKIDTMKHSAARTGVEQAADTSPIFKIMKKLVREMYTPHASSNSMVHYLENEFEKLQCPTTSSHESKILRLSNHKKKAITSTLPKLPQATGKANSLHNVTKGFVLNGQVDSEKMMVPSISNMLHTYRGGLEGTCLEDKAKIVNDFYSEAFVNGVIAEATFDALDIPQDRKMDGSVDDRCISISRENRQRAKILSSRHQIIERRTLLHEKRMDVYRKQVRIFQLERDVYRLNSVCEQKLVTIWKDYATNNQISIPTTNQETISFDGVREVITYDMIMARKSYICSEEAKSFLRVRSNAFVNRGRITYHGIPTLKGDVLRKVAELLNATVNDRLYPVMPSAPELDLDDLNNNSTVSEE